jgi:hypothetical protein
MKPALQIILAMAIASESVAETMHESFALQPHIEPDLKKCTLKEQEYSTSPGGNTNSEPLGILRGKILYKKMRRAQLAKNELAMADAFIATARSVVRERALRPFEREIQFNCLRAEIEMISRRTCGCHDYSSALPAIANALDVPYRPPFASIFPSMPVATN